MPKTYQKTIFSKISKELNCPNEMLCPKLIKIVLNSGVGKKDDSARENIKKGLEIISGQKVSNRGAKKAIAGFKTREGNLVGYSVTMRGDRMYNFLEKFINVAVPRMRDFRGFDEKSVDDSGNLTIGIKEHIVFPEMVGEESRFLFGFETVFVSSAGSKKEGIEFFRALGIPFKKQEENK